jgi:hypothetical protein
VSHRAVGSGCPRASRSWFVVLAVSPFWGGSSGEARWRNQRTPALNPGRDPSPLPGVAREPARLGNQGPADAVLFLGETPGEDETCAVTRPSC